MKKFISILLAGTLALTLTACGDDTTKTVGTTVTDAPVSTTTLATESTTTEAETTTTEAETTTTEAETTTTEAETTTTEPTTTTAKPTTTTTEPATTTTESTTTTIESATTTTKKPTTTTTKATTTTKKPTTTATKKPTTTTTKVTTTKKPTITTKATTTKKPTTTTKATTTTAKTTTTTKKPTTTAKTTTTTASDPWGDWVLWRPCDSCGESISELDPSCPHCGVAYYQCPRCRRYTHSVERDCISCMCGHCEMNFYHCSDCGRNVEKTLDVCPHCGTKKTTTTTTAYPTKPIDPAECIFNDYEMEIMQLINAERAKVGQEPLKLNTTYRQVASARAKEISINYSHTRPDGKNFHFTFKDYNLLAAYMSENILSCSGYDVEEWPEATKIVEAWMNSEGHRNNMLYSDATDMAIALSTKPCSSNPAKWYVYAALILVKPL